MTPAGWRVSEHDLFGSTTMEQEAPPVLSGKSALEVLAAIDDWASEATQVQAFNLWWVLTALRGPDGDEWLKPITTAVIRFHSLPVLSDKVGAIVKAGPFSDNQKGSKHFSSSEFHFLNHARQAWAVLEERAVESSFKPLTRPSGCGAVAGAYSVTESLIR